MGLSTSIVNKAYMVEKTVNLGTASGTVVGPAVGAGTLVLAAGVTLVDAVEDITTFTVAVADDTTTFMAATSVDAGTAGAIKFGTQTLGVTAADTIDAVTVISGTTAGSSARVWALVVDVNEGTRDAAEVDRDTLA
tara:strand:- start:168 stop:575 length:408 start_codon:yes stop_codon:yes gene_type:complete